MLTVTEAAQTQIAALLAERDQEDLALRVVIAGRRAGQFMYQLGFVGPDGRHEDDVVVDGGGFDVLVDPDTARNLAGATIDFIEVGGRSGFHIENPNPVWPDEVSQAVQRLLDEEINPGLRMHGGFVSLVEVKDDVAYLAFGGGCQGCGMIDVTLKEGIEGRIKEAVPRIKAVVDVTDHSQGENPFYQ